MGFILFNIFEYLCYNQINKINQVYGLMCENSATTNDKDAFEKTKVKT